jgi:hypothetical protein
MQAELKLWMYAESPAGLDPLRNRPKIYQIPSSVVIKRECKETDLPRHGQTQTGYGAAIPTRYMVKYGSIWRRVYCASYGNSSTLYIGKPGAWIATVESIDGKAM